TKLGLPDKVVRQLDLLGFSGISNVLSAIKMAKYYELTEHDIVLTILTDSMELYQSRLIEMQQEYGDYTEFKAAADFARYMLGQSTDNMLELSYTDRKRVHNLKYFTWVEQQGKTYREIQDQWYEPNYWCDVQEQVQEIDALIEEFNADTGVG
ncbi:MAG TPA: pyridoxal-5-phosphate-dependent protein subunit beta, partial [Anaerolineales bacterium]